MYYYLPSCFGNTLLPGECQPPSRLKRCLYGFLRSLHLEEGLFAKLSAQTRPEWMRWFVNQRKRESRAR